eukprot:3294691-Rhodomonas_salina.1
MRVMRGHEGKTPWDCVRCCDGARGSLVCVVRGIVCCLGSLMVCCCNCERPMSCRVATAASDR